MNKKKDYETKILRDIEKLRLNRETWYEKAKEYYELHESEVNQKDKIILETINNFDTIDKTNPCEFEYKCYSLVSFQVTTFGKKTDYLIVENVEFYHVDFNICVFINIKFINCKFFGCIFNNCNMSNVIFDNTIFNRSNGYNKPTFTYPITEINACNLKSINFKNSDFSNILFDDCNFYVADFNNVDISYSFFKNCSFTVTNFINSNINHIKIITPKQYDVKFLILPKQNIYIDDVYITNPENYIVKKLINFYAKEYNKVNYKEVKKMFYNNISTMYNSLLSILKEHSNNDELIREYSYIYQYYSFKTAQRIINYIIGFLSWLLCGFGDRMNRFILWFIGFVFSFSILYMFTGIKIVEDRIIDYSFVGTLSPIGQIWKDFLMCLNFSIVTLSTVGYGNIIPIGNSHLLSSIQMLIGIGFVSIFTAILIKKVIK